MSLRPSHHLQPYDPATYGDSCADFYDDLYGRPQSLLLSTLAEYARHAAVLELGIGTGRVAVHLASRGVAISGIEASAAMIDKLRDKPGGWGIPVHLGDFADFVIEERFELIFALSSTMFLLPSTELQRRCFKSVSRHLTTTGCFILEVTYPASSRAVRGARRHFGLAQSYEIETREGRRPYSFKYLPSGPAELDEMASEAGLCLTERWCGWSRDPCTRRASHQISIYRPV